MKPHHFFIGRTIGVLIVLAIAGVWYLVTLRPSAPTPSLVATASYACDGGKSITAAYYRGEEKPAPAPGQPPVPTGKVALTLSDGRSFTLPQTISGSGIRYANADESFVFWSKGNGAFVTENNQQTYSGCVAVAPASAELPQIFASSTAGFSIRLPEGYTPDESYRYQEVGPGKDVAGIKFTIPAAVAAGTNLSVDTYLSVEEVPQTLLCTAALFLEKGRGTTAYMIPDGGTDYSVASSTGAGAGNRYDETVYAIPGTNPCIAVRYFIHYGVIQNYPEGVVREFDETALLAAFGAIRRTLTLAP